MFRTKAPVRHEHDTGDRRLFVFVESPSVMVGMPNSCKNICAVALVIVAPICLAGHARAQCIGFPVQTNQTCTNSTAIVDTSSTPFSTVGLQDAGTLTLSNLSSGTIKSLTGNGIQTALDANALNFGNISGGNAGLVANRDATLINFGVVSTPAWYGVLATNNATIVNSGSISGGFLAIDAGNNAIVENSGIIKSGVGIYQPIGVDGISAGNAITLSNSGTISADDVGVRAPTISVANTGTITGLGSALWGINTTVVNSGSIVGTNWYGIDGNAGGGTSVQNTGSIYGAVAGIKSDSPATIANNGTISGATGVISSAATTLANSGTIIGSGGTAVQLSNSADTLTLLPGSRIVGALNLGGPGDTINLLNGSSAITFDSVAGDRISTGGMPFVVSANKVVVVDPTMFGHLDRALFDITAGINALVSSRIVEVSATSAGSTNPVAVSSGIGPSFLGAGLQSQKASAATGAKEGSTGEDWGWAKAFGGRSQLSSDGVMAEARHDFGGILVGGDVKVHSGVRLGFVGGWAEGDIKSDAAGQRTESSFGLGGLYARFEWGAPFVDVTVLGGRSHNSADRAVANNLVSSGVETAHASYRTMFLSPAASFGWRLPIGDGIMLVPAVRGRYLADWHDGYTETGSQANLSVASRSSQDVEGRVELGLSGSIAVGPGHALVTHAEAGVLGIARVGDKAIDTIVAGQTMSFLMPGREKSGGFYGGAGVAYYIGAGTSIFADVQGVHLSDEWSTTGQAGMRVKF